MPSVNPGLCETCSHVQIVRSSKGSSFVLCRLSEVDPAFRRYPALPVTACPGYSPSTEPEPTTTPVELGSDEIYCPRSAS